MLPFPSSLFAKSAAIDADAQAYINAMQVKPNQARTALITNFIKGLKDDGDWPYLDSIYLLAGHHEQATRINVKKPYILGVNQGMTFLNDIGWRIIGGTGSIQFPLIRSDYNFSRLNAHAGVFFSQVSPNLDGRYIMFNSPLASISSSYGPVTTSCVGQANGGQSMLYPGHGVVARKFEEAFEEEIVSNQSDPFNGYVFVQAVSQAQINQSYNFINAGSPLNNSAQSNASDTICCFHSGRYIDTNARGRIRQRIKNYLIAIGAYYE